MAKNTHVLYWQPTNAAPCPHPTYVCDEHFKVASRNGNATFGELLKTDDPHRNEQCRLCWMRGEDI